MPAELENEGAQILVSRKNRSSSGRVVEVVGVGIEVQGRRRRRGRSKNGGVGVGGGMEEE